MKESQQPMFESEMKRREYWNDRVAKLRQGHRTRSTDNRLFHNTGFSLLLCLTLIMPTAVAGGSWERVLIDQIAINGVDYTLVVVPSDSANDDPYFGKCKRFEVHGTYRCLKGALFGQESGLSRADHLQALEFLRRANKSKQPVDLGWIGVGFVPLNPPKPYIVRSRALQLLRDGKGTHVLSYHTATSARSD